MGVISAAIDENDSHLHYDALHHSYPQFIHNAVVQHSYPQTYPQVVHRGSNETSGTRKPFLRLNFSKHSYLDCKYLNPGIGIDKY